MLYEALIERFENVVRSHPGAERHRQRLARVLVQNRQHLGASSISEFVMHDFARRCARTHGAHGSPQTWFGRADRNRS